MSKKALIVSDKKAGHLNQSIAFCKLKNLEYDIVEIKASKIKKIFSYILDQIGVYKNIYEIDLFEKDYQAVISTGSSTYYVNKYIAKKLQIKSIAIMLPRGFRYSNFDYILAQEHDMPPVAPNIISIPLNLSINTPKGYIEKKQKKAVGIILGGNNSIFTMDLDTIKKELKSIYTKYPNHLKYITTSRRTPKDVEELLEQYQFDYKLIYSNNPNINPIPDFIEVCNELFISIDSTSMLCEAKANSEANIHIIKLDSTKENTKFHILAKKIESLQGQFDYDPYLKKVIL